MDHYVELQIVPDPEFEQATLMNALFSKLHRALVAQQSRHIGVSFPAHRTGDYVGLTAAARYERAAHQPTRHIRTLGNVLRLHGSREALDALMATPWLRGMRDHLAIQACQPVPPKVSYRTVQRKQSKTNAERLRRRRAARHNETLAQARAHIPDSVTRQVDLPYVQLSSQSTQQRFCLFIHHGEETSTPQKGTFNSYGLSATATIPWF